MTIAEEIREQAKEFQDKLEDPDLTPEDRNKVLAEVGLFTIGLLTREVIDRMEQARFDGYVQAAMIGILASGKAAGPRLVPAKAFEIATHMMAFVPETDDEER